VDSVASALGDAARWRIVELLAEAPRSVGELAELTGLRQPQTTKHLQTLARAGLVAVFPLGQRRVYALEGTTLEAFARRLHGLVETAAAHAGDRDVITRYDAAIRLRLDVNQLPKPFQVNALASREWTLASDWYRWTFVP